MNRLPVIVSLGGVGAAGRTSGHHAYRRTVVSALDSTKTEATWRSLAGLTGRSCENGVTEDLVKVLADNSLVRRLGEPFFDPDAAPWNRRVKLCAGDEPVKFEISKRDLPESIPAEWSLERETEDALCFSVAGKTHLLVPDTRRLGVASAGMVPTGFEPGALYPARSHPRGLELTVFAASDAINNLGIEWQSVVNAVAPDQFSTYAGSAMTQLDQNGNGGLLGSRYRGQRVSSKQVPLALGEMAADFTNAYVLGSLGQTGHNMGACATFHYNLRLGVQDIREGRSRVAVIGGVEAPLVSDAMDGLATMGALIQDATLLEIEGKGPNEIPDYRRACRPFGANGGFVMGEGAQFVVMMDAELALELGADILGTVGDVFVHADGHKKSISSPGVGNYVTFAKAVASARRELGAEVVSNRSFVHAHGTGTPQNRTSESEILDKVAQAFDIRDWPVAAIKCFVGHTMAAAGGDQLVSSIGTWCDGVLPGITTIDDVAEDVSNARLLLGKDHLTREPDAFDVAFLNAKGFGGNNATAWVMSPQATLRRLEAEIGSERMNDWRDKVEHTRSQKAAYDDRALAGELEAIYKFDHDVRDESHISISKTQLHVEGYPTINL